MVTMELKTQHKRWQSLTTDCKNATVCVYRLQFTGPGQLMNN